MYNVLRIYRDRPSERLFSNENEEFEGTIVIILTHSSVVHICFECLSLMNLHDLSQTGQDLLLHEDSFKVLKTY